MDGCGRAGGFPARAAPEGCTPQGAVGHGTRSGKTLALLNICGSPPGRVGWLYRYS